MEHEIKFKVGETRHKQPVYLIKQVDGSFEIRKRPANQRDTTDVISGLDAQTIRNMIKAVDLKLTSL